MPHPSILGLDPGARWVGLALRQGHDLHFAATIDREKIGRAVPFDRWVEHVADVVVGIMLRYEVQHLAVEAMNDVTPHLGRVALGPVMETARTAAWLHGRFHSMALWVPPARHGTSPLRTYPPELVGPRETTGKGHGPMQHQRAGYDIAGAGAKILAGAERRAQREAGVRGRRM